MDTPSPPDPDTGPDSPRGLDDLIAALTGAPRRIQRMHAAHLLSRVGWQRLSRFLAARFGDGHGEAFGRLLLTIHDVRPLPAEALARSALGAPDPVIRAAVAATLASAGDWGVSVLLVHARRVCLDDTRDAIEALARWAWDQAVASCEDDLLQPSTHVRLEVTMLLGRLASANTDQPDDVRRERCGQCEALLVPRLRDPVPSVRKAVLRALADCAEPLINNHARRLLIDADPGVRVCALDVLGTHGDADDVGRVVAALADSHDRVRRAALCAAVALAPDRRAQLAQTMLTDPSGLVARQAVRVLAQTDVAPALVQIAMDRLAHAQGESGRVLVELIRDRAPGRLAEVLDKAGRSPSFEARVAAAETLAEHDLPDRMPRLRGLLRDRHPKVRLEALGAIGSAVPDEALDAALVLLGDKEWTVRAAAVKALAGHDEPWLVDDLLPLARDEDEDVRQAALGALARFDDRRVFGELVSSLNDVDADVRRITLEILEQRRGDVPVLRRLGDPQRRPPIWERVRAEVEAFNRWARGTGQELLGCPVVVEQYRQGLGRTRTRRRGRPVQIEVTDTPITSGHRFGRQIMQGLALHEIGHHLCDVGARGFRSARGVARSEGVGHVFDMLLDERLERLLRSRRPEWGVYFDRLASYAFAQNVHRVPIDAYAALLDRPPDDVLDAIARGELPGQPIAPRRPTEHPRVALRDRDMLAIPHALPTLAAVLTCLRCGFDPRLSADPDVPRALAMVPDNLKDLTASEVLDVARRIADVVGRSDVHKRDMQRLRQRLRTHRQVLRALARALDRLAETGQLSDWAPAGAPGIRRNPPVIPTGPCRRTHPTPHPRRRSDQINLGPNPTFEPLANRQALDLDPKRHAKVAARVRKHVRRLRAYLERLGQRDVDLYASRRGHRVDLAQARRAAHLPTPDLLVFQRHEVYPDAYVGELIDRSGSMDGHKLELAKAFGVLVAESAKGLPGIEGHVNAFDGDTFYALGDFRRNAIASLSAHDGNNDAGGLAVAADLALRSRKRHKLIVMISDGLPTECTFEALKGLVDRLTHEHAIVCVQVAVDKITSVAFPHHVDLSACAMDEALNRFGRMLIRLTTAWR